MKKILYYRPAVVTDNKNINLPGIRKFSYFFKLYSPDVTIVDRTGVIKMPVNIHNLFPLPKFKVFTKTYEEICNERAKSLLQKADSMRVRLCVMYSGGVDSTLVVVSLLKNATEIQKKNITIFLSEESILENPNFYKNHIEGKLRIESSIKFPYIFGTNILLVTGEHNDQLFGSDIIAKLIVQFGESVVNKPYSRELLISFFNTRLNDISISTFYVDLFEKLVANAPIKIQTNFEFLWWINFALKWQTVFIRMAVFTSKNNISSVNKQYMESNYETFYGTEDFQLWSMNNLDKRIKNTWVSYKWLCKDIIFDYTKDQDYRDNKIKIGSLGKIMFGTGSFNFVDDMYTIYKNLNLDEYYVSNNDFI
jgi:hypothetical protein